MHALRQTAFSLIRQKTATRQNQSLELFCFWHAQLALWISVIATFFSPCLTRILKWLKYKEVPQAPKIRAPKIRVRTVLRHQSAAACFPLPALASALYSHSNCSSSTEDYTRIPRGSPCQSVINPEKTEVATPKRACYLTLPSPCVPVLWEQFPGPSQQGSLATN